MAPWSDRVVSGDNQALTLNRDHGGGATLTILRDAVGYASKDGTLTHMAQTSLSGPLVLVAVRDGEAADQ
jgi:hypothetical protein